MLHRKQRTPKVPLLREFILQRVLPNLVPVLAAAGEMPLEKPTELADRTANYSGAGTAVASATVMTADTKARQSRIEDKIDRLAASITAIRISAPGLYHGSSHRNPGCRFLVDTDAEASVIRTSHFDRQCTDMTASSQAPNYSTITTFPQSCRTIDLGLRRTSRWIFIVADERFAIFKADFLMTTGVNVDVRSRRPVDSTTSFCVRCVIWPRPPTSYRRQIFA
ncbi:hypothetical protein HPB52_017927 [Rhipicephalus sanguineus]|uniref:Tick transposon n=1 Tax=Rhipicephalus sanguineus TaxID=34632 RepID=A0A9D4SUV5_RHISA|nr:hypothetical protein HPB52_017927 [Rhipicephalus sanguineus]